MKKGLKNGGDSTPCTVIAVSAGADEEASAFVMIITAIPPELTGMHSLGEES